MKLERTRIELRRKKKETRCGELRQVGTWRGVGWGSTSCLIDLSDLVRRDGLEGNRLHGWTRIFWST